MVVHALQYIPVLITLLVSSPQPEPTASFFAMSSVAVNRHQIYAIVCQTPPADGGRVLLKTYDSTNAPVSQSIVVNDQYKGVGQNSDVIIDDLGIITVVWEQSIDSRIQIGVARFGPSGNQMGVPNMLKDERSLADQMPRIAIGSDGRFTVVWCALGKGISGQRFSKTGNRIGNIFRVSQNKSQNAQYPSVKLDKKNRIGVVWQEGSNDDFRIVAREFDWNLHPSRLVQVDNGHGLAYFSNPDLLFLRDGSAVVAWKDYRSGDANIFQQLFDSTFTPIGKNIRVNDDTGKQWQRLPRLASAEGSNYTVLWEDYRNDFNNQIADIYFQKFTRNGKRIGENGKVDVTREPTAQRFPAAAVKPNGDLIVTWSDTRWNSSAIYMVELTSAGREKRVESQVFP
jgi:hypothetical protein